MSNWVKKKDVIEMLEKLPQIITNDKGIPHNAVSRELFNQIKGERDIAVSQLRELNIELGERVGLKAIPIKWLEDEIEILKKQDDWVLKTFGEYSDFSTPYEALLKRWRIYETDWRKDNERYRNN